MSKPKGSPQPVNNREHTEGPLTWWGGMHSNTSIQKTLWPDSRGLNQFQENSQTRNDHFMTVMSNTPRSPRASNSPPMTSTTMTSPSARRPFMGWHRFRPIHLWPVHFGPSCFGPGQFWPNPILANPILANPILANPISANHFGHFWCHGGAPKGGGPKSEKVGPEVVGPWRVGALKGGRPNGGGPNGGGPEGWGPEGWGPDPNLEKVGPRRVGSRRVGNRRVVGPEGWGPEGWGPEGWGHEGGGLTQKKVGSRRPRRPRRVGLRRVGGPKFRALFPSPAPIFALFVSLWGSSRGFLVVFESAGALKCARLEFLGCRVKPRRVRSRLGFTPQPESPNVDIWGPRSPKTPPKFKKKTPRENRKNENCGGRGKKKAKFWGVRRKGVQERAVLGKGGPGEGRSWGRAVRGDGGVRGSTHENLEHTQHTPHTRHTQHTQTQHTNTTHTTHTQHKFAKNGLAKNVIGQKWPKTLNTNFGQKRIGQNWIGQSRSWPLHACRRRADHSEEEGLSSCLSSSVSHDRTGKPVVCRLMSSKKLRDTILRLNRLGLSWSDKESRFSLTVKQRFINTNSKPITTEEVFKSWMKRSSQKGRNLSCSSRRRRQDQQLLHEQLLQQNWDLREAHEKSLNEMEELKRFQGSTFDTIVIRKLVEDRDTILELTGKIQELHNEINCRNDSKDFQDAESVRSGLSHVTCVFPTSSSSWWNAEPFYSNAEPQRGTTKHLGHTWYIGKRFCKSSRIFFTNSLLTGGEEWKPNTTSRSEMPVWTVNWKFNHPLWDSSKNYGVDQQRLQILDLHFDKFPTPATFACWKIRFKMVDSVDDLRSSSSVRGIRMPDIEVLDAKIASALNRIIHNSHFKRRVSLEE